MILDALHSDEETFFGADVSDDEGIDSASRVAISPDQDEPTGHDDWFSDDEQAHPKVVAAAAVGQPDIESMSRRKKFPRRRGLLVLVGTTLEKQVMHFCRHESREGF